MRVAKTTLHFLLAALVMAAMASNSHAAVAVGSSSLIQTLDYSDTFTGTDFGGLPDRDAAGGWTLGNLDYGVPEGNGIPGEGLAVENCYGNAQQYWTDWDFSTVTDTTQVYTTWYPELPFYGSGAGSDTGMTQTGALAPNFGFAYGLRDKFVVQFDAICSSNDRTGVSFGTLDLTEPEPWNICDLGNPDTTSIFVRQMGSEIGSGEIAIWHSSLGEVDTGLMSPIIYGEEWHNFALEIDLTARTIEVFVDENSLGVIDVDTVAEGALNGVAMTNESVWFSAADGDYLHYVDNFQVGSPDVDPLDPIPGDATRNGVVDEADAAILAANWGLGEATWDMGNFNDDDVVDMLDASILAANWGATRESAAVPEPTAMMLILAAMAASCLIRKRL